MTADILFNSSQSTLLRFLNQPFQCIISTLIIPWNIFPLQKISPIIHIQFNHLPICETIELCEATELWIFVGNEYMGRRKSIPSWKISWAKSIHVCTYVYTYVYICFLKDYSVAFKLILTAVIQSFHFLSIHSKIQHFYYFPLLSP